MIKKKVATISFEQNIKQIQIFSICELEKSTPEGYTFSIVAFSGETVGYMSKNEEGEFIVEELFIEGKLGVIG